MKRHAKGLAVVALLLAACGTTGGAATTVAGTTDTAPSETTIPPAEDVVLVVEDVGGFVPIEFALGRGPRYVLTGDGRLIFQGPMIEIFPQPLWPNYQVRQLTDDELDLVMDAILVTGIDQITDEVDDNSANVIADASTTVITYYDDQGPHRFEVYALDIGEGQSGQVQRLAGLVRVLDGVATADGEVSELEPERVQVIAQEAEQTGDEFDQVVDFPIDEDPATWDDLDGQQGIKCAAFEGQDAEALVAGFRDANQATLFEVGETTWRVYPRPLLPGEEPCEVQAFSG
jgi:hypothetical protein